MLKYLVFLSCLILLPEIAWTQTRYAMVDYAGLTDSLYERFEGLALVDSVHTFHWAKGLAMVKPFQQQVAAAQKLISSSCMTPEQQNKLFRKLEKMQQEIANYEKQIFNTAIPALDSSLCAYLDNLALQTIRKRQVNQPDLKFFDKGTVLYSQTGTLDLTQELLAYINAQRIHRKRFSLYAASKVVSLGLNAR